MMPIATLVVKTLDFMKQGQTQVGNDAWSDTLPHVGLSVKQTPNPIILHFMEACAFN